jgi:hypothetical protein
MRCTKRSAGQETGKGDLTFGFVIVARERRWPERKREMRLRVTIFPK